MHITNDGIIDDCFGSNAIRRSFMIADFRGIRVFFSGSELSFGPLWKTNLILEKHDVRYGIVRLKFR